MTRRELSLCAFLKQYLRMHCLKILRAELCLCEDAYVTSITLTYCPLRLVKVSPCRGLQSWSGLLSGRCARNNAQHKRSAKNILSH